MVELKKENELTIFEEDIKKYIENNILLQKELGTKFMKPLFTSETHKPCIVYKCNFVTGNIIKHSKVELKIIHKNYDKAKYIESILTSILNQYTDEPFIKFERIYFHSSASGSGILKNIDWDLYEMSTIYTITWRCINDGK